MGLFKNLFAKKPEAPKTQKEEPKQKGIIKSQRFKVDHIEDHMDDIMECIVEKNEDYKLSKKALLEDGREDEKIYKYVISGKGEAAFNFGGVEKSRFLWITYTLAI